MTEVSCLTSTVFPEKGLSILNTVLRRADNPADMGTCLTEEISALTGASCVLLIQCLCTPALAAHRVVGVHPPHRRQWAESQAGTFLYEAVHQMPEAQQWCGEETTDISGLLQHEGFERSIIFPLNVGTYRVGAMLVLGLPGNDATDAVFELINNLSTIMALVLRNAILYEKQEQIIRERTAELEDKSESLAQELAERKQAERTLRENEERFRTLVSNIPGIVYRCACDEHWTMSYISNTVTAMTGYPASDFIGNRARSYLSVIHPDDREMVTQKIREGVAERHAYTIDYRIIAADGSMRNVYEKGQGIYSDNDQLLWLDGAIFDITERKRAEQELNRLNTELEQRVTDRTQELERRNHELEQMLRAFVGRELKMVELKEQIKALEQRTTGVSCSEDA